MSRGISLTRVPQPMPEPSQKVQQRSTIVSKSTRLCVKCGLSSALIVLYRNDAAVDFCKPCWAHMPSHTKAKAVNIVELS